MNNNKRETENPLFHVDKQNHEDKLEKVPIECHNGITQNLWSSLSIETRKNIYSKCLQSSFSYGSFPEGVNNSIWSLISDEDKTDILLNTPMISSKYRSNIYKFIFDVDGANNNYDTSFSAISIVSALLLTIPFASASYFDSDFLETLTSTIENCPESSKWGKSFRDPKSIDFLINNFNQLNTNIFFASLLGIIISTVYFILKPSNLDIISKWSKLKLKFLAVLGSMTLLMNIIFLMNFGICLSSYVMVPMSNCGDDKVNWAQGIIAFVIILFLSVYLLA